MTAVCQRYPFAQRSYYCRNFAMSTPTGKTSAATPAEDPTYKPSRPPGLSITPTENLGTRDVMGVGEPTCPPPGRPVQRAVPNASAQTALYMAPVPQWGLPPPVVSDSQFMISRSY